MDLASLSVVTAGGKASHPLDNNVNGQICLLHLEVLNVFKLALSIIFNLKPFWPPEFKITLQMFITNGKRTYEEFID